MIQVRMRAMQHASFFKFFSNTDKSAASRGISEKFSVPLLVSFRLKRLVELTLGGELISTEAPDETLGSPSSKDPRVAPLCHRTKYKISLCLLNQSTFCLSSITTIEQWEMTILLCPILAFTQSCVEAHEMPDAAGGS